jgi:membrane protease YdiL (CAAX protease family)
VTDDELVLRLFLTAGLAVALGGAIVSVLIAAAGRSGRDRLFPPTGPVLPARDGLLVVAAFFAFLVAQYVAALFAPLWGAVVVYPVLFLVLLGFRWMPARPASFGMQGWGMGVVGGYLTWLLVTPAVFVVFVLATKANLWLTDRPPDKHPLTQGIDEAGVWGWPLFFLQTVLLAALVEEMVFRGLLLPWLAQKRPVGRETPFTVAPQHRSILILFLAVGIAALLHAPDIENAWAAGDRREVAVRLLPAMFILALVPFDFLLPRWRRLRRHLRVRSPHHVRAVWASAALFAAIHSQVWPSPVPLFVLALGLGYLYLRTRSLVGPVVVHGMFNAVSAVYLLLGGPA